MSAKIFVVEDEALTVAQLKQYIEEMGHQVAGTADNAETALEQIRQSQPDLVLMDIRLNGAMDGVEAAARLQLEGPVALIYLTAYPDDETLARAKLTEPYGYLVKPFNKQSLQASIEIGLYRREMEHKQQRIFESVVQTITDLTKLHDSYLKEVPARAAALAEAIAIELGRPKAEARAIRLAAMLHRIGLVGIPGEFIYRSRPLEGVDKDFFQTHPEIAWQLLQGIEFPYPVAEMVYQHMERLDGSGFPRGLSGKAILPGARIVAVACEVARMLTPPGPETPPGAEEALNALEQGRGTRFDAEVVDACARLFREKGYALPA